jgi:hypothetical protein
MKKINKLYLTVAFFTLLTGCAGSGYKTYDVHKDDYDKTQLPIRNATSIRLGDIEIDAKSMGALWLFSAYTLIAKGISDSARNTILNDVLTEEFNSHGIPTHKNGDFIIDAYFSTSKDSDYEFLANFTIKNKFNHSIFSKQYISKPSHSTEDSDEAIKLGITNGVRQFIFDVNAQVAMGIASDNVTDQRKSLANNSNGQFSQIPIQPKKQLISKFTFVKNEPDFNKFALIIGINEYDSNPNVRFADNSAVAFEELAISTLGVPKENVITLLNGYATSGRIKTNLELIRELPEENGTIYLFYAGHGVPGKDGNSYLLPADMGADAIHLEPQLKLNSIYKRISTSLASNIYVFMDSCFSGKDDLGELLYKGVAPVLKVNKTKISSQKLTILSAGGSSDFANDYEEKEHRLFSYHLINELASGQRNLYKAYNVLRSKVKRTSLRKGIGYKQIPQYSGNKQRDIY